jgi:hypothetical protein
MQEFDRPVLPAMHGVVMAEPFAVRVGVVERGERATTFTSASLATACMRERMKAPCSGSWGLGKTVLRVRTRSVGDWASSCGRRSACALARDIRRWYRLGGGGC